MLAPHQSWSNFLWHERLRCIYAVVPKSGTTSIKRWFVATHPHLRAAGARRNVHDFLREHCTMDLLFPGKAAALLSDPHVFKFTFVRNPWSRLVSGYLDKIVGVEPVARKLIRRHYQGSFAGRVNWRYRRLTGGLDRLYHSGLTFREFVAALGGEKPEAVNPHFRLQSQILKGIPLDFIGRIEQFATDFAVVQARVGDDTPAAAEHKQSYAGDGPQDCVADWSAAKLRALERFPKWQRFYPTDVADQVRQIFADDFEAFGYSREPLLVSRAA